MKTKVRHDCLDFPGVQGYVICMYVCVHLCLLKLSCHLKESLDSTSVQKNEELLRIMYMGDVNS